MSSPTLAATGHSTVPAPANFSAVASADKKSITTSWDPVPGAIYTLKEKNKSPNGVDGAIGITETTSIRHPHGHGVYEYYVVAIKNGAVVGESEHVTVDLSDGHTPPLTSLTGGSAADILQIGPVGGHWNLGIGPRKEDKDDFASLDEVDGKVDQYGIVTITEHYLRGGFEHPDYFTPTTDGKVCLTSYMEGALKPHHGDSGSDYTRTELRELETDGKALKEWGANDGKAHTLSGTTAVTHMPGKKREICVAQVHDDGRDRVQIRVEGPDGKVETRTGFAWWVSIDEKKQDHPAKKNYTLGEEVTWEIHVEKGKVRVTIDGHLVAEQPFSGGGQYFKVGCYTQSNYHKGNPKSEYEQITLRNLRVSHENSH